MFEIHGHAIDHVFKRASGQPEPLDNRLETTPLERLRRVPVVTPAELGPPLDEVAARLMRKAATRLSVVSTSFIDGVIHRATEVPHGNDRLTFGRW
jgi:hypothetical protein